MTVSMSHYGDHSSQRGYLHHTAYQGYTNLGQQATEGGNIYNLNQCIQSKPLEELENRCSHSAAFDSAARSKPPRCAESTRVRVSEVVEDWMNSDGDTAISSLFWLHGGAGVGKSALAQSLSEKHHKQQLAASFFFFRGDPTRNNGDQLIPTIVSQLVHTFEGIGPFVEDRIRQNPALFLKRSHTQIEELLVEPLFALKSTRAPVDHPRLIIIDGLDECEDPDIQCELLRVIAGTIPRIPYPLRIFITSRPEAHMTHVFNHDREFQAITVHQYNLSDDPDADMDIHKFLEEEFMEIRRVHRLRQCLSDAWPAQNAIASLVERSSGHFIYASTVIQYIASPKHHPDNQLQVILRLRPPQKGDQPYAQLDALYKFIFRGVESPRKLEEICLVLGILYFRSQEAGLFYKLDPDCTTIEGLLEMEAGDLVLLLDPILSLVTIDGDKVRILHKSLFDYLLDLTRGGHLPFDLARVHESSATYILKQKILKDVCDMDCFRDFAYHCRYAHLNDVLKDYLYSLEIPCPESIMTMPNLKKFSPWSDSVDLLLESIIWDTFRTLSRESDDFDSGQAHKKYATNCLDYFHQTPPKHTKRIRAAVSRVKSWLKDNLPMRPKLQNYAEISKMDDLETLLTKWKPKKFNPMDVGKDPIVRIKQEHSVFSAFAKASFSDNASTFSSSLVLYLVAILSTGMKLRL